MLRRNVTCLRVEALEGRLTPAGNVFASLSDGVLEVRGDAAANAVRVTQDSAGIIRIEGLDGTTINGQAAVTFNGSGLEKADLRLAGGNDRLEVLGLRTRNDLRVEMGGGSDVVSLTGVSAGTSLTVKTDAGNDQITATRVRSGGDLAIEAGWDNDRIDLTDVTSGRSIVVKGDLGGDFVAVTNVVAARDALFRGEDGFDTFDNNGVKAGGKLEIREFEQRI